MNIIYYSTKKNNYFTESMKEIALKGVKKIEKYLKEGEAIKLTVDTNKNSLIALKCQVVLKDNYHLRYETSAYDYTIAVITLFSELKDRILKHNEGTRQTRVKNNREKNEFESDNVSFVNEGEDFTIMKEKVHVLSILSDNDAIQSLLDGGYDFYLYKDEVGDTCLIYKRFDGSFGKIVTK